MNKKQKKEKKDKFVIFTKIMAGILAVLMLAGTCYSFIYLIINS